MIDEEHDRAIMQITQEQFHERCTKEQWESYVQGLIQKASDEDTYYLRQDGSLEFLPPDEPGGQSTPILRWDDQLKGWVE